MATNNVLLSALVAGGLPIPVGGEDVFAEITLDPRYTVGKSMSGEPIFNKVAGQYGEISITVYEHDPANLILRGMVSADNAAQGLVPLPGVATTALGTVVKWTYGKIIQEAPVRMEQTAQTVTYTIAIGGYSVTKVA